MKASLVPLLHDFTVQDAPAHKATIIGTDPGVDQAKALDQETGVEGALGVASDPAEKPSLLAENFGGWLIVAGVGGLIVILFRNLRKHRKKSFTRSQQSPRERIDEIQDRVSGMNDMHAMTARAQESVQVLITQLENKAARLEVLLDTTEARIAEFDAKLDQMVTQSSPSTPHPTNRQPPRLAASQPPAQAEADQAPTIDPLHKRVHALADQGLDSVEIARQINRPTGQVDLILALRRA